MSDIDILGSSAAGLRIGIGQITALAPTKLLQAETGMAQVPDQAAAEWAAALSSELARALTQLSQGQLPSSPFDQLILERQA